MSEPDEAAQRGQSLDRMASALQQDDLLRSEAQVRADPSLDARLRLATLNLMQDAIAARSAEQEHATQHLRVQAAFHERDMQLRLALDVAEIGTFTWDIGRARCEPDERMRGLCGWSDQPTRKFTSLEALMPPLDQPSFADAIAQALKPEGSGQLNGDFAIRLPGLEERWLALRAAVEFDAETKRAMLMRGAVLDTTERKRAEVALRASEQRFRQFAAASADVLWIRDAESLRLEFVSAGFERTFGVAAARVQDQGFAAWASLIMAEDRDAALENIRLAQAGSAVVEEHRIVRPVDGAVRWIQNTMFSLLDGAGRVQRIAAISRDISENKLLSQHQSILVAELQHRVRNIMSMIRAIASRTASSSHDLAGFSEALIGRIMSIARTQGLLTQASNVGVDLRALICAELAATALTDEYQLDGPSVLLSPKAAEVLSLVVHELATNALKYGAFAKDGGSVRIEWQTIQRHNTPWLQFLWREKSDAAAPGPKGFGSELIVERVPYELRGEGELSISASGVECSLRFPLADAASILETDAPPPRLAPAELHEAHDAPRLNGQRILLVEDDYYLAQDARRALRRAGAQVLGPCSSEAVAQEALAAQRPDCAVLDINLGAGPSFVLARQLRQHDVPFIFFTGYDAENIPPEFDDIRRLQKPAELRELIRCIAELLQAPCVAAV